MKRWQFWLGILISAACMAWVISQVKDWPKFGRSLIEADYWYLAPIIAFYFVVMFFRAVRWKYILDQCGRVSLRNSWVSILVCYMGNNIFPLRAGEFMRVFLIGKQEKSISYSAAMATVVIERLFDFLSMLLLLAVVLMFVKFPEHKLLVTVGGANYELQNIIHGFGMMTLIGAAGLFVFLFLLHARSGFMIGLSGKIARILPGRLPELIVNALERFTAGLVIMGRPRALLAVAGMSIIVWAVNLLPVWLSGLAFGVRLNFIACMFMMVVGAAAASIPATPGFFGTFHAFNQIALVFIMRLYGPEVSYETALSFAIVLHATYYLPVTIAGAIAAWREGYSLTRLKDQARDSGEAGA